MGDRNERWRCSELVPSASCATDAIDGEAGVRAQVAGVGNAPLRRPSVVGGGPPRASPPAGEDGLGVQPRDR